jgi:ABC-type amino acid transport substrate-binding protein
MSAIHQAPLQGTVMYCFTVRGFVTSLALASAALLAHVPAHADMEKIRASGKLVVAVYNDFIPFSGKLGGIDADLAEALAKKLNLKVSLLPFPAGENINDDLRNMVWKGHYLGFGPADVMLHVPIDRNVMAANDKVEIFAPYHRETIKVVRSIKSIPDMRGIESLEGKLVGAEKVSISGMVALGEPSLRENIRIYLTAIEALQKLKAGELDAVVATRSEIEFVLRGDAAFEVTDAPFQRLPRQGWVNGMAVKKENVELARELQAAVNGLFESGEMSALFAKHGVKSIKP